MDNNYIHGLSRQLKAMRIKTLYWFNMLSLRADVSIQKRLTQPLVAPSDWYSRFCSNSGQVPWLGIGSSSQNRLLSVFHPWGSTVNRTAHSSILEEGSCRGRVVADIGVWDYWSWYTGLYLFWVLFNVCWMWLGVVPWSSLGGESCLTTFAGCLLLVFLGVVGWL